MKTTLSFGLMALVAVGLISMRERQQEPTKESVATVRPVETAGPAKTVSPAKTVRPAIAADTIPSGHRFSPLSISINDEGHGRTVTAVATDEKGNTYVLKEVDGKVMEFSINAKLIAKENYSKYVDLFDRIEDYADAPVPPVPAIPAVPPIPAMPAVTPVTAMPAATAMPAVPPMPATPPVPAIPPVPPVPPVSDYYIRHIIRDLRSDKIIDKSAPLSFTLDNNGFTVNGAKQPAEVIKRYQQKYLDRPKDHFIYEHRGGSTHTDISTNKKEPEEI